MGKRFKQRTPAPPRAAWVLGLGLLGISAVILVGGSATGTPASRPAGWNDVPALVVEVHDPGASRPWFWPGVPVSLVTVTYAVDGRFLEASYTRVGTPRVGDTYPLAVNPADLRESVDSEGRELVLLVRGVGLLALVAGAILVLRASRATRTRRDFKATQIAIPVSAGEATSDGPRIS